MLQEELPGALERIRTTAPNVVVFGCTSAGALGTLSHDECIAEMAEVKTAARTVTVLQAVLMQLSVIRPRKLAVLTPYIDDLTNGIVRCLTEANHTPIKAAGMGIEANLDIGRVVPAEIVDFVEQQISGIDPDCLFLSCTNWRALDVIEPLQKKLSIPVISSNQAAIQAVQQLSGSVARRPEK
jgi:maleate isomerase